MATTMIGNRSVVMVRVDGVGQMSNLLLAQLGDAADQAESTEQGSTLFVHIAGYADGSPGSVWPGHPDIQTVSKWERILHRIERANYITCVFVEQACSMLALEVLAVADRRLAREDFSLPCATPGRAIWPSIALHRLSRQIGEVRTRKLFLDCIDLDAHRGKELGIIDDIVSSVEYGLQEMDSFLKCAPLNDFAVRRRLVQDAQSTCFNDALGLHLAACDRALRRSSFSE